MILIFVFKNDIFIRTKKKKTEMGRIRKLVDLAYECDPRIAAYMAADKKQRDATLPGFTSSLDLFKFMYPKYSKH